MKILHYFLGPLRQGGLNRYARDLALAQQAEGHQVTLLYPDGGLLCSGSPRVVERSAWRGMTCLVLKGGRPVPLLGGIRSPEMILDARYVLSQEEIQALYQQVHPDVLHIHTWMGFPGEILPEFHRRGCRILFTTHDYFGLCPKVSFMDADGQPCTDCSEARCSWCNAQAPRERYLALRNWEFLLKMRRWLKPLLGLAEKLRSLRRRADSPVSVSSSAKKRQNPEICIGKQGYDALREYYLGLLRQCDVIHCNSEVSRQVYAAYLPDATYRVLPITHGGIRWNPPSVPRPVRPECIQLGFSGAANAGKGLPLLRKVLEELPQKNWHLTIWGTGITRQVDGHLTYVAGYQNAAEAFAGLDLLVVPSVWKETFGFIVPEALAAGIPVLCSDSVGAQILLPPEWIYHGEEGLRLRLQELLEHPEQLQHRKEQLAAQASGVEEMSAHARKLLALLGAGE